MPTANENIRDALIRHQIALQNLSEGLSRESVAILDKTEASIMADIRKALENGASADTDAGLRQLQRLQDAVVAIRDGSIQQIAGNLEGSAIDLVRHEAEFTATTLDVASPTVLDLTLPSAATLTALVTGNPFEGDLLGTWMDKLSAADTARIMDGVKIGLTRGLGTEDIVRSIFGSQQFDGADGLVQVTRNSLRSLVRTAVNAYSNQARSAVFAANTDIVQYERYTATLDSHTTRICASLDGTLYPVGEGRFPPQHFGCRSIRVAAISADAIGQRPMKPFTERMLVTEFADANGIDAIVRSDIQRGLKGAFDTYARGRVRELTGTVAAKVNYQQFLTGQSATFQNQVLGVAKGKLFRDGGLSLSSFVGRSGNELTLAQLARTERDAFARAGIDPARYTVN